MVITNIFKSINLEFKWSAIFLGAKRVSHSTEGPGVGVALGKFDSSDSNEMFTNAKIRKTKIWGLKELKMLFRVVDERTLNIHKS